MQLEPVLVGRRAAALRDIAERHGMEHWTTDRGAALGDPSTNIY
jgi:hypothetical protein